MRSMSFLDVNSGPWRGVAFLVGADAPENTPPNCESLTWRHDGTARLSGGLERAQAQLLIDASVCDGQSQRARPEPFPLRDVTTTVAGEGFVFAGELFGQEGAIHVDTDILVAQLTLAPSAEIAVAVDPRFEYALIAPDEALQLDSTAVPHRSVGIVEAGRRHIGVINCGDGIAHALLVGGLPDEQ